MKKIIIASFLFVGVCYANQNESLQLDNNPVVNSKLYSGALFPEQNKLYSNVNDKINEKVESNNQNLNEFNVNNTNNSKNLNSSTVNSKLYSGAQFPMQNQITNYPSQYSNGQEINNPVVNSKLYSGAQFPEQNNY